MRRQRAWLSPFLALVSVAACADFLGADFDDLKPQSRNDSGAALQSGGGAGSGGGGGSIGNAGKGAAGSAAADAEPDVSTGGIGGSRGSGAGESGAGTGGTLGSGGSPDVANDGPLIPPGPVRLEPGQVVPGETFGRAVDIEGDRTIIGASADNDAAGVVYEARRSLDGTWAITQRFDAAQYAAPKTHFGDYVSLSGDWLLVAAWGDWVSGSGAVYVFRRESPGGWTLKQRLLATTPSNLDRFGWDLDIDADRAFIGSYGDTTNGAWAGAVYVFRRQPSDSWTLEQKIFAPDARPTVQFGSEVDASGNTLVIGAYEEDTDGPGAGAAYLYTWTGSQWSFSKKLTSGFPSPYWHFGGAVSIDGDNLVIGAHGPQGAPGRAHFYRRDVGGWPSVGQVVTPPASEVQTFALGWRLDLVGDTAVIMMRGAGDVGSGFVHRRQGGVWQYTGRKLVDGTNDNDLFGWSVAFDGTTAAIGSIGYAAAGAVYHFGI